MALSRIEEDSSPVPEKLEAYANLYAEVLRGKRMCMCGILAAEYPTLPKPMRDEVRRFFDENQRWLADLLTRGRADRTLAFEGDPNEVAQGIVSTLEGAMLVARSYGDVARFNATARQLLTTLAR
jgi:TetR/AcrR family transcriptional repressor of nem operon